MRRLALSLSIAAVAIAALAPIADARTTAVVRNGAYGMLPDSESQIFGFKLRNREVSDVRGVIGMTCHTYDTNTDSPNTFLIRGGNQTMRIAANGRGAATLELTDAGRNASVNVRIRFTSPTRAKVSVLLISTSAHEHCLGTADYNVRRGVGTTGA